MFARTKILTARCSSSFVSRLRSSFTVDTLPTDTKNVQDATREIPRVAVAQTPPNTDSGRTLSAGEHIQNKSETLEHTFNNTFPGKSKDPARSFYRSDLVTTPCHLSERQAKPTGDLPFGKYYADHMIDVDWNQERGWAKPKLHKLQALQLHPGAKVHLLISRITKIAPIRGTRILTFF